ncbi:MAG: hypothetical protein V3T09_04515, partial [bacterium]
GKVSFTLHFFIVKSLALSRGIFILRHKAKKGHPLVGPCQAQKTSLARKKRIFFRVIIFNDNRDFRLRAFVAIEEDYEYLASLHH